MKLATKKLLLCLLCISGGAAFVSAEDGHGHSSSDAFAYEVWAPDQSNSVEGQESLGVKGGWLWIWDSEDVHAAVDGEDVPASKPCSPDAESGPCDLFTIFPESLTDSSDTPPLGDAAGFGRWHGITKDPQNKYVTANIFAPNGGFIGIVDTETKGAVGLFRTTEMTYSTATETEPEASATTRNVHMSFWNADGSAILIHNLAGKALERINVERDDDGKITALSFDKSATLGLGRSMQVASEASFYEGDNAFGDPLLGGVTGSYEEADLGDLTPTGYCKENGCEEAIAMNQTSLLSPGRPNNVPICPVMGHNNMVFNTLGGGGLLVVDSKQTPMAIVGAYGNSVVYGAGVCGAAVGERVYVTSGASASAAGADQSMFAVYAFEPALYEGVLETALDRVGEDSSLYMENEPVPILVYDDEGDTATGGKTEGEPTNDSGQVPGTTTRRDAHDLVGTLDGKYVHVVDRIQNVVEVFDSETDVLVSTYDLTTETGMVGDGTTGPCAAASIKDGGDDFPINDPAPDFIDTTPDGKNMLISFRGPAPVSAGHAGAGSCPGVGIVELLENGSSGKLVAVLRTTHTTPDMIESVSQPGGVDYTGEERSDIHDLVVIFKDGYKEDGEDHSHSHGDPEGQGKDETGAASNVRITSVTLVLLAIVSGVLVFF